MNRERRIERLQEKLSYQSLLIEDRVSLFYLTQLHLSEGKLLITKSSAYLFVDGRYFEACQNRAPCPVLLLEKGTFKRKVEELGIDQLLVSAEDTSCLRFQQLQEELSRVTLHAAVNPVQHLRKVKDYEEIALLKQAATLCSRGFAFVRYILKEGITELEVAKELELFWISEGGKKVAFDPIIAFGANSSQPHYRAGRERLKEGDPVLIDIGVTLNEYHSDMTRVLFFKSSPPKELSHIYQVVKAAQQCALDLCAAGITAGEMDRAARDVIKEAGYGELFTHSLGHGIGLEVHEGPSLRSRETTILESGMVVTIEPGIYLPGKYGVRIEDTVIITSEGHENLTLCSKKITVVS